MRDKKGKTINRLKRALKIMGVLVLCSVIIAIPMTVLTLSQSMKMAESVYREFSMVTHYYSPSQSIPDESGIPMDDGGYKGRTYIGKQRNPLSVATAARDYYNNFMNSGNMTDKTYFENCINWLETTEIDNGRCSLWAYNYYDSYTHPPWYSALVQARIMLVFERAYELTGEKRYQELATKAMLSLDTPIEDGGVMYQDADSVGKWYAEVASHERDKPPFILNGHMEVLMELWEYYNRTGSQHAHLLFQEGVAELKPHLKDYDTGYWTYYDREGNLAYDYHYTHIQEVRWLYEVTGDEIFKEYHDRWASYIPFNPLWARKRFAAYLFNVAIIFLVLAALVTAYMSLKRLSAKGARET